MLLRKHTNNLFDDFFGDMFEDSFFSQSMLPQMMKTDVLEKDGQFLLDIELPGYDKKDVQAELKDGYLTIEANKDQTIENKDDKSNYVRKERYTGSMKRTFYVGEDDQFHLTHFIRANQAPEINPLRGRGKAFDREATIFPSPVDRKNQDFQSIQKPFDRFTTKGFSTQPKRSPNKF